MSISVTTCHTNVVTISSPAVPHRMQSGSRWVNCNVWTEMTFTHFLTSASNACVTPNNFFPYLFMLHRDWFMYRRAQQQGWGTTRWTGVTWWEFTGKEAVMMWDRDLSKLYHQLFTGQSPVELDIP